MNQRESLPNVSLANLEGPYDLLIELARKRKINLADVSLGQMTDSFLDFVRTRRLHPEVMADFVVVASTLLLLKMQRLLPGARHGDEAELEQSTLAKSVSVYAKYREQAAWIRRRWRRPMMLPSGHVRCAKARVRIPETITLTNQMAAMAARAGDRKPTAALRSSGMPLKQLQAWHAARLRGSSRFDFPALLPSRKPADVALSLLSLLELHRQSRVTLDQGDLFGRIRIESTRPPG